MPRLATLLLLSLIAATAAAQKPSAMHQIPAPTALLISDIHFDPFHDPAKVPQLFAAPADQWEAILAAPATPTQAADFTALQNTCKAKGIDTPYDLLQSAITNMQLRGSDAKFISISGDLIAHKFDCRFNTILPNHTPANYLDFVTKTIRYVALHLHTAFPAAQLYLALGNNDSACGDYRLDENSQFLSLDATITANGLPASDNTAILATYPQHGDYTVRMPAPIRNARIIVLDDLFQGATYTNCDGSPNTTAPAAQLAWLKTQLDSARAHHEHVWVMAHIPPGVNPYSSLKKNLCGSDNKPAEPPVEFLANDNLSNLLAQYADVIKLAIFAHTHMDEMRLIPAAGSPNDTTAIGIPVKLVSSISPVDGNNPTFTVATIAPADATLTDYTVYAASNQTGIATSWPPEYTYSTAFSQPDFSAASAQKLITGFLADPTGATPQSQAYMSHYFVGIDGRALTLFWHEYACALPNQTAAAFTSCTCATTK